MTTPYQAPNCNAYAERFVLSIKSECLDRMIFFGEASLRKAIREYLMHYHFERAHQGIGNVIPFPDHHDNVGLPNGRIKRRERLGGLLSFYHREAG